MYKRLFCYLLSIYYFLEICLITIQAELVDDLDFQANKRINEKEILQVQVIDFLFSEQNNQIYLLSPTPNTIIYYTLDGMEPSNKSLQYKESLDDTEKIFVLAFSYRQNCIDSSISIYQRQNTKYPHYSYLLPHSHKDQIKSTISAINNCLYSETITILNEARSSLKTVVVRQGYQTSGKTTVTFEKTNKVKNQQVWLLSKDQWVGNHVDCLFIDNIERNILTERNSDQLYYTLYGTDPDQNSTFYRSRFPNNQNYRVKVRSFRTSWLPSDIVSSNYQILCLVSNLNGEYLGDYNYLTWESPAEASINELQSYCICSKLVEGLAYALCGTIKHPSTTFTDSVATDGYYYYVTALYPNDIEIATFPTLVKVNQVLASIISSTKVQHYGRVDINILSITDESTVYYGSEPTTSSKIFQSSFTFGSDSTLYLQVGAFNENSIPSHLVSQLFTVTSKLDPPEINHVGQQNNAFSSLFTDQIFFENQIEIILSHPRDSVEIRYTLGDNEFTGASLLYQEKIVLTSSAILSNQTWQENWNSSEVIYHSYLIVNKPEHLSAPVFTDSVLLSWSVPSILQNYLPKDFLGYHVYLNDINSFKDFQVFQNDLLQDYFMKIIGLVSGKYNFYIKTLSLQQTFSDSEVFVLDLRKIIHPAITPQPGRYYQELNNTLSYPSPYVQIFYTLDCSDPKSDSFSYQMPILVLSNTDPHLKYCAYLNDFLSSNITKALYQITGTVQNPTPNLTSNLYLTPIYLELFCTTLQSSIYYTLDGSAPDSISRRYKAPILLSKPTKLKKITLKPKWKASNIISLDYRFYIDDVSSTEIVSTKLHNPYPTPFFELTTIPYSLAKSSIVEIEILHLLGQKIATLENIRKIMGNNLFLGMLKMNRVKTLPVEFIFAA